MRSSDLAHLAGITPRTLRHYHQVGVLPEPARSSNGYRNYDPPALVTVLRIRRLVDLGFSLTRISTFLHQTSPTQNEVYDSLDAELSARIDDLTRQRAHLAQLRHHGAPPDLPLELAAAHDALRRVGLPDSAAAMDRDHTLLLTRILGATGQEYVRAIYGMLSSPDRAAATVEAMTAWADLNEDSTRDEIDLVIEQLTAVYAPIVTELTDNGTLDLPHLTEDDLQRYGADYLTGSQRTVLRELQAALENAERFAGGG